MMNMTKKILAGLLAVMMLMSLVACGGNGGKTTVDENQTDFYVVGGMSALSAGYDSNTVLNKMQEDAGITIEWDTMSDSLSEQVNIRIAGEQLPDAFQGVGFNNYDLSTYGADGTFIDLTPYITPEIMPNLSKILEENPDIRAAIAQEDGGIYGLPSGGKMGTGATGADIDLDIGTIPQFTMINKAWLDELGLDIPGVVQKTGLSDRQVRTIITRQMKVAPLDLALQLTDTLNVPLEVWLGVKNYSPTELSADAYEVARAYDRADLKSRNMVRMALDLPLVKGETV